MQSIMSVTLTRDCEATQIPSGIQTVLVAGTQVDITQTLGGSYTVHCVDGGLYRLGAAEVDALGLKPATGEGAAIASGETGPVDEAAVWAALKDCYDPELPLNIVDLGLVYDMAIEKLPSGSNAVKVKMTLTAPGCGMGGAIAGDAQQKLLQLPGVETADVDIVWEPAWHPSLITPEGKRILGLE
jgi:probable FeS assembly SUF system protein SufT